MAKSITFLVIVFFSNLVTAQSVNDLDLKNGFRHFKLRSSPLQIKNIVQEEYPSFTLPNVINYKYIGDDLINLFGVKIEDINLGFFKNQLFNININFGNFGQSFDLHEFNLVRSTLEEVYGTKWFNADNEDGIILNGCIWDGNNVRLELLRIDFSKSKSDPQDYGYIGGYIHIFDKNLMDKMYKSSF